MRKTKIVATLGPATCTEAKMRELIAQGLNIARLNGAHNTLDWHRDVVRRLRSISPYIPILLDIPGRKVRTGILEAEIPLKTGETITFSTDERLQGTGKVPVTYSELHKDLKPGNTILADDGTLKFEVVDVNGRDITCRIENDGTLRSAKGLNVPYVKLNGPILTQRDQAIIEFAKAEAIDFVGISFVESAAHVAAVRQALDTDEIGIISKIENKFGIDNLAEIAQASDGLMIDRGDLTAETEIESLALMQKMILREARQLGKPVIVATEMLHTMITNPRPTKAEVNDISNAVLDGAAAIMLSGETAIGEFPAEAVSLMGRISGLIEKADGKRKNAHLPDDSDSIPNAISIAIAELCRKLPVTKVICLTAGGFSAKMLSSYRLNQPILAVTNSLKVARNAGLSWGVQPIVMDLEFNARKSDHIIHSLHQLYLHEVITASDLIVVTAVKHPKQGNKMNTVEVYQVRDLIESQGWASEICGKISETLSQRL